MERSSLIVTISVLLILTFIIGYFIGSYTTIKAVASIAKGFVDKDIIDMALNQYSEKLKNCYPLEENAFIYNSTGN